MISKYFLRLSWKFYISFIFFGSLLYLNFPSSSPSAFCNVKVFVHLSFPINWDHSCYEIIDKIIIMEIKVMKIWSISMQGMQNYVFHIGFFDLFDPMFHYYLTAIFLLADVNKSHHINSCELFLAYLITKLSWIKEINSA